MGTLPSWGLTGFAVFLTHVLLGRLERASHGSHVRLSVTFLNGATPQSIKAGSSVGEQMFWKGDRLDTVFDKGLAQRQS